MRWRQPEQTGVRRVGFQTPALLSPCGTPDRYFQYAACTDCDDLAKLIAAYKGEGYSLVRKLRAATAGGERQIADETVGGRGKLHSDTMEFKQGSTVPHLLRRLARERPDILAA